MSIHNAEKTIQVQPQRMLAHANNPRTVPKTNDYFSNEVDPQYNVQRRYH